MSATPASRNPMFATSLANGLSVLRAFSASEARLTHGQLAQRTNLSKASITRLTATLIERGLLRFDAETRCYAIGSAAITAGFGLLATLRIRHVAMRFMQAFAERERASVSMGLRNGSTMVYVETCRSHDAQGFRPDVGGVLPILSTAMGRAWLAAQPAALRRELLASWRRMEPQLWQRNRAAVVEELAAFEERGFCLALGDFQPEMHAAAVPLRSRIDGEVLVINYGVPAVQLAGDELRTRSGPGLRQLAQRIDAAWDMELGA